ncbi:hypothetical protein C8Q76DRAFT_747917 [Earliella scabrosa]|nr:hypothetical protein C8Q76DRAFT_747917 [Earliella scabrosa]
MGPSIGPVPPGSSPFSFRTTSMPGSNPAGPPFTHVHPMTTPSYSNNLNGNPWTPPPAFGASGMMLPPVSACTPPEREMQITVNWCVFSSSCCLTSTI